MHHHLTQNLAVPLRSIYNENYLKLEVPTSLMENGACAHKMLGIEPIVDAKETAMQKWVAVQGERDALAVINNGIHGVACEDGRIGLTLLRSPGYSAADGNFEKTLHEVHFMERIDQGERKLNLRVLCGERERVMAEGARRSEVFNMEPYALACSPPQQGERVPVFATLDAANVVITAMKLAKDGEGVIVRMVETDGQSAVAKLRVGDTETSMTFKP